MLWHDILLFLHLIGLALGLGLGFANMFIARQVSSTENADGAAALRALPPLLGRVSQIGLGVLIVTGILLFIDWKFGSPFNSVWFWLKMLVAAAMVAVAYLLFQAQAQIRRGETPRFAEWIPRAGPIMGGLALLATLFAVFVFH